MLSFESESALVEAYQAYLQARGIPTRSEVPCGKGGFAADLVSRETVWEAKLLLDREHLYQAFGQGESYRQYLGLSKLAIFGLLPEQKQVSDQSQRIAKWLCDRHPHLWIYFVNHDSGFINFCNYYDLGQNNASVIQAKKSVKSNHPDRSQPIASSG